MQERKWLARNEQRCLQKISSSHVVKLLAHDLNGRFENKDAALFVLEYAPNGNLRRLIEKLGPLSDIIGRTYLHQIISGINACHKVGVIHRDLKLENIVLDVNYNAKICDFGLAKVTFSYICI